MYYEFSEKHKSIPTLKKFTHMHACMYYSDNNNYVVIFLQPSPTPLHSHRVISEHNNSMHSIYHWPMGEAYVIITYAHSVGIVGYFS